MNEKMFEIMKNKPGFIAALDQSGGSSSKTLKNYGIEESEYSSEEEMFNLIHEMRKRVFTSKAFTNDHIIGAILFEKTMLSKVNGQFTADYLWNEKQIVSFLKVDKGLAEQANGVKLMKEIPELDEELKEANEKNIFGTKMRSVIYEPNEEGIKAIVKQQFELAERICNAGLVPIIEPEVDINAPEKEKCEEILKADFENDNPSKSQENATNILKEDSETYNLNTHLNKKHDKLFKEILSDKKEAVKFINHYLNLCLVESDIEKYEKEFRTNGFYNIEADIVYKLKEKNVFILIEHQSSVDLKMAYRVLCYKDAIIESAIDKKRLKERNYKIPKVIAIVLYTGKRKWNSLSINDIEERIDGYENPNNEYHLIDSNEFSRNKLLSDNLITSKAMLIEKSKNKDELYKNIEDVIHNQIRNNTFDNTQLEKLVRYELAETEDNNIISKFLEKIRNIEGGNEIMTNASRIINNEIRKQRREGKIEGIAEGKAEGKAEGIALIAKKLKGQMHIKDISQITGLSEEEIKAL